MVTARPLAASRVTLPSASPNLNKDARITKAGDKAGDGDSMRVAARRRRSTARHRGCRLQGGVHAPLPPRPLPQSPPAARPPLRRLPGRSARSGGGRFRGLFSIIVVVIISRGWFGLFLGGASFFPCRRRGSEEKRGKNLTAAPLPSPEFFVVPSSIFC